MESRHAPTAPKPPLSPLDITEFELDPETVRDRFQWARRHGHPAYLWPDVSFEAWKAATAVLGRVTRKMVASHDLVRMEVPADLTSRALGIAAFATGMGPLLGHWLETDRLETDPGTAALLALHLDQGRKRFARVERLAIDTVPLLRRADPDAVLLKGFHTAREYFPEPGTRPVADVDVLIAEPSVERAERALEDAGFIATTTLRLPYRRDWVRSKPRLPRSLEVDHEDNPIALDLHGSLARVFSGTRRVDLATAGLATTPWKFGDVPTRVLAQPLLTAFLAMHASEEIHHLRLVRLFELITVIRRDTANGRLEWQALSDLFAATASARFCYPALALAEKLGPETVAPQILADARAASSHMMRRVVDRLEPETCLRLDSRSLAERFMWAATPADALRCAAFALRPGRTNAAPLGRVLSERFFRVIRGRVSMRP
jgi:hypothetical protein